MRTASLLYLEDTTPQQALWSSSSCHLPSSFSVMFPENRDVLEICQLFFAFLPVVNFCGGLHLLEEKNLLRWGMRVVFICGHKDRNFDSSLALYWFLKLLFCYFQVPGIL